MMKLQLTKEAERQYKLLIKSGQKKVLSKVAQIFDELEDHPREGLGRPECLKYFPGEDEVWSREIDKKNRLVYIIKEEIVLVLVVSILGHYQDK